MKKNDLKKILNFFNKRKEVIVLYLFGSFGTERENKESDIDIGILIDPKKIKDKDYEQLKDEYYSQTPKFSLRPVNIVILNTTSLPLRVEIFKKGQLLIDKNPEFRNFFIYKSLLEYYDYVFIEKIYFDYVKKRLKEA